MNILKFHTKSTLHFGLLSSAYLIIQRLNLLKSQINYLKCPYDVITGMQYVSTTTTIIPKIFRNHVVLWLSFLIDLEFMLLNSQHIQSL